jgi:prevent-host-death family protein
MLVSIADAKGNLEELVRCAEAGEEIVLTRYGKPVARLAAAPAPADRKAVLSRVRASGPKSATPGPEAARSQDFLYDKDAMPG